MNIPKAPQYIIEKLQNAGFRAGLVGGSLRNFLLGLPIKDYDVATSALIEDMREIFKNEKIFDYGLRYGTLCIMYHEEIIEVTTFRKEADYLDYRHPLKIEFIDDLKMDLSRRDFTINALFYSKKDGLIDYFNGISDLENKVIRGVGNPHLRFKEDPLRILRALRFSSNLNFNIEEKTSAGIFLTYKFLANISTERIANELIGIFKGENYRNVVSNYYIVFTYLIPSLNKTQKTIPYFKDLNLRLIHFFSNIEDENFTLKSLKLTVSPYFDKHDLKIITTILKNKNYKLDNRRKSHIKLWMNLGWDKNLYRIWIKVFANDEYIELPDIILAIKGNDLYTLGIERKYISSMLNELLYQVILEKIPNDKKILLEKASKLIL